MPFLFPKASPSLSPEEVWTTTFNQLSQRMRRYFIRSESHQRALAYMQGLMSSVKRKNGWQVPEDVGEATQYAIQHLLDRARWDCDIVRHSRARRKLPDRRVLSYTSSRGHTLLDRRPRTLPRSPYTSRADLRYQAGTGTAYATTNLGCRSSCRLGSR
jgi:hypothetical protein